MGIQVKAPPNQIAPLASGSFGGRIWALASQFWPIFFILRLPFLLTATTYFIFNLGQSQEVLESLGKARIHWPYVYLCLSTLIWALFNWYSCRILLYHFIRKNRLKSGYHRSWAVQWLPRVLGAVTFEAVIGWHRWTIFFSVLFLVGTFLRRQYLHHRFWEKQKLPKKHRRTSWDDARNIHRISKIFFLSTLAAFLILAFLMASPCRFWISNVLGSAVIVCAGLACLSSFLTAITLPAPVIFPIDVYVFAWLIVVGKWNDNHEVRTIEPVAGATAVPGKPLSFPEYFDHWWEANGPKPRNDAAVDTSDYPVFIVTAEGGGIKAAYWTAGILSRIQDKQPEFAKHLLAISGVSGGSVGAATFTALLADQESGKQVDFERQSDAILSEDHLSPVLGMFFFSDCLARFSPIVFPGLDRAKAMEASWERSWRKTEGNSRFGEPFLGLWKDRTFGIPALFLNGTLVESGQRAIMSNVRVDSCGFSDAVDLRDSIGRDVPLSASASMSARFPFITPSARVRRADGTDLGHVVDGGYYENSGAATAIEALESIRPRLDTLAKGKGRRPKPVILIIRDTPPETPHSHAFLNDLLDPFLAAYNTRQGRTSYSLKHMRAAGDRVIEFNLSDTTVPLGWYLSKQGTKKIGDFMDSVVSEQFLQVSTLLSR